MIRVRIYRCKDSDIRTRIRNSVHFYIKKLLPHQRKILVKIFFNDTLWLNEDMIGSCLADDWPSNKRHKEFSIHIDTSLSFNETLATLAHELTHVKQYASSQMSYDYKNGDNTIWNGILYTADAFTYEEAPWEIEATQFGNTLLHELLTTTDIWKPYVKSIKNRNRWKNLLGKVCKK